MPFHLFSLFSQIVPFVGDDEEYSQALSGLSLGVPYDVQIQALDRNSYVLYTSPDVRSSANCLTPNQPPAQLAIDAPDPRHIRLTWVPLPQSAWRCGEAQVELQVRFMAFSLIRFLDCFMGIRGEIALKMDKTKNQQVDEPRGMQSPVVLDARQSSHVFDASPAQRWTGKYGVRRGDEERVE